MRIFRLHRPASCAFVFFLPVLLAQWTDARSQEEPNEISLEWMYKKDELGIRDPLGYLPGGFRWSPEGHLLAFRQNTDRHGRILVVLDPETPGKKQVLTARMVLDVVEDLQEKAEGVPLGPWLEYSEATVAEEKRPEDEVKSEETDEEPEIGSVSWLEKKNRLRFKVGDHRVLFDPATSRLFPDQTPALPEGSKENLQRSPDGRYAAWTRENDLYVFDLENAKEVRLTSSGSDTLLNGRFPWVYWEEMMWRRTYRAFYWRPQGDAIAYLQFDEESVATYPITDFSEHVPRTRTQRYPKVGTTNPSVRLGIVSLSSRETRWVDLGEPHEYLILVDWRPDGSALTVQAINRRQNRLRLYEVDVATARGKVILEEARDTWVDLMEEPRYLADGEEFIWVSERSGFRHLYLHGKDGREVRPLTKGPWEVAQPGFIGTSIFLDEKRDRVYYRSTQESPLERHIYWAPLGGGRPRRVTAEPGGHFPSFSSDHAFLVDRWSSFDVPSRIDLLDSDGKLIATLGEVTQEDFAPYRLLRPEPHDIAGTDGLVFHASLLKPPGFDPARKYPVVAYVYGEPAGQVVLNRRVSSFDMVLANNGFLVFRFDGRGTPGRGRAWLDPTHKNSSDLPVNDWKTAVSYLEGLPYVDGDRLGIWGSSGGGTMTLNLMLRAPGLFQAGAALAAVSDKKLYTSFYTERYLGLLDENAEGYERSSPLFAAGDLEGDLLIAHGVSDDNVHIQNSYNLIEALSLANKDYQLYLYPQKDHGIGGDETRYHLQGRILDFFLESLADKGP